MISAIRQKTVVQPGGLIQIRSSELPVGATAEVIVILESPPEKAISLARLIGRGKGGFATPEEADAFIHRERDAWDL